MRAVVAFGTGGATDVIARIIVATLFFATSTQVSALPSLRKNVPFDPPTDLTAIGGIGNFSFFWAVHPSLPVKSLKELAEYELARIGAPELSRQAINHRTDPDPLRYGGAEKTIELRASKLASNN